MIVSRIGSLGTVLLLVSLGPLSACEIPPPLLAGRDLPQTRQIVTGEVVFVADARLHDFEGRTSAVSGLVMTRKLEDAVGCVVVQAGDLDTGIQRRNELMWRKHLEVSKYPEIRFVLTGLGDDAKAADRNELVLEGELTLHGVTHRVRIPAGLTPAPGGYAVEGATMLRMGDYGIRRPAFLFLTVKDEVAVRFRVLVGEPR